MKKLFTVLLCLGVFSCAGFAQEKWSDNIRIEGDIRLGVITMALELKGAYMFQINEKLSCDAGLEFDSFSSSIIYSFGSGGQDSFKGTQITAFASIWFRNVYLKYGIGTMFDKNNVVFVPYDIRFGWQPHFSEKDKGWCFKMETGLIGFGTKGGVDFIPLAIGATYKF